MSCPRRLVALISVIVGILVRLFANDPHYSKSNHTAANEAQNKSFCSEMNDLMKEVKSVIGIPTFLIIVAQGLFGSFQPLTKRLVKLFCSIHISKTELIPRYALFKRLVRWENGFLRHYRAMANIFSENVFFGFPSNLRVLAIDADPKVLEFIKRICTEYGHEVIICTESLRASEFLRERKVGIDLVLMEVHMPMMDGYEFLLATQEIDVPVIMMSSDDSTKSVMKSIKLGGCDYWIKPLHEDRLKNMWTHVVRKFMSENKKRKDEISREVDNVGESASRKKSRVVWTSELHGKFVKAVNQIGLANAVPKKVLELMNMPGLSRSHVASHLQKYRNTLRTRCDKRPQQQQAQQSASSDISVDNHLLGEEALSFGHPVAPYTNIAIPDQHFPQSWETMLDNVSVDTLQQQQMQQWMNSFFS